MPLLFSVIIALLFGFYSFIALLFGFYSCTAKPANGKSEGEVLKGEAEGQESVNEVYIGGKGRILG